MISPVADIGPWVIRLDGLPVKTIFSHSIGIVPIKCRGIEESIDHAINEGGVGER